MRSEIEHTVTGSIGVVEERNGAAMAAFLAAGIGAAGVGFFVLLNELGLYTAPSFYEPAGGVSGRTTLAIVVWLVSWVVLHYRWRDREVRPRTVLAVTLALTGLGILGTFPPVWGLLGA